MNERSEFQKEQNWLNLIKQRQKENINSKLFLFAGAVTVSKMTTIVFKGLSAEAALLPVTLAPGGTSAVAGSPGGAGIQSRDTMTWRTDVTWRDVSGGLWRDIRGFPSPPRPLPPPWLLVVVWTYLLDMSFTENKEEKWLLGCKFQFRRCIWARYSFAHCISLAQSAQLLV